MSLVHLRAEFGIAKWVIGLTLVAILGATGNAIWWSSKINTKVEALEARFDRFEAKVDARFDRLEASIAKILEQTRPATPKAE